MGERKKRTLSKTQMLNDESIYLKKNNLFLCVHMHCTQRQRNILENVAKIIAFQMRPTYLSLERDRAFYAIKKKRKIPF